MLLPAFGRTSKLLDLFYLFVLSKNFKVISYTFLAVIIPEEEILDNASHISDALGRGRSMDSIPSTFTNGSCSPNSK